ncbi:MAG TPA: hypothetical protein ENH05_01615 [Rhizobiales bacterium]|nr:hypothetical protein BMS3Bbin10_00054 [bacterium BMS3Bbin10]HDO51416.1 hypothetical protein [Hyphomicrobiales bacterium]
MPVRAFHFLFLAALPAFALVYTALGAPPAAAQELPSSRVFVPAPPKGKGDKCIADKDFMRRNHMKILEHQRDQTVYDGVRIKRTSLKECVACHVVNGPDALPLTSESPKYFCRVCHDYAAVKVDCFECHVSRPPVAKAAGLPAGEKERDALASFLKEGRQ